MRRVVRREARRARGNVVRSMFRDWVEADYYLMVDGDDPPPGRRRRLAGGPAGGGGGRHDGGRPASRTVSPYGEENDRAFHGFGNDLVRWLIKVILTGSPSTT